MDLEAANHVLASALAVGPRCGSVILVGIDGRSGAGKSTLAARVSDLALARHLRTTTVHVDVLCPDWDGLPAVRSRLVALVEQLAADPVGSATYPTWDWIERRPGPDASVPPSDLVIIEGVTASDPAWAERRSVTVWVEAPAPLRKERAIARDGDSFARHWDAWAAAEDDYFGAHPPPADLVVDGR